MAPFFWAFLFYGFCGYLLEITFARLTNSSRKDRKCHFLFPVCPVYGLGAVGILALPDAVLKNPLFLFPGGALVCTAAEWLMACFYEKVTRTAFWDYSCLPGNWKGRVCFLFSFFWGLLAFPLVYWLQPLLQPVFAAMPASVTAPVALFYTTDAILSVFLLRQRGISALRWPTRKVRVSRAALPLDFNNKKC